LGLGGVPILLAPRGEFNPGALALKRWKKRVYIGLSRFAGLPARLHFHATSEAESVEIRRLFGASTRVKMATNFGPRNMPVLPAPSPKKKGELSLVFLSRLVPKKNLHFIFPILAKLRGQITLKVWGPEEDVAYVRMVRECVRALPSHISVTFCGEVASVDVWARLAESHFFVLPTLGENHGHAIVEAWQAGLPVVLSDRTPWRGLEDQRLGWDLPLEEPQRWIQTLQTCLEMSHEEFQKFRTAAFDRGACSVTHPPLDDWRQMFTWALQNS
jgi:glycosyltransferase involved in cell wall biosynthesis